MSAFVNLLSHLGAPALAVGIFAWRVARAVLLHRAGSTALNQGTEDQRREAGLAIVEALTRREREPWYRALMPWHKPGDGA